MTMQTKTLSYAEITWYITRSLIYICCHYTDGMEAEFSFEDRNAADKFLASNHLRPLTRAEMIEREFRVDYTNHWIHVPITNLVVKLSTYSVYIRQTRQVMVHVIAGSYLEAEQAARVASSDEHFAEIGKFDDQIEHIIDDSNGVPFYPNGKGNYERFGE